MNKDDIPIGESSWIEFIDLADRQGEAVQVDSLLVKLFPLWEALEQHCVAECCGFDAFDFYPNAIVSAATGMDLNELHETLSNAISDIEALETTIVVSDRLNNYADKKTFLALLAHIKSCVQF
ncbi:DUF6331 family protein [Pseudodesulfovibrio sediminis]|uniref:Uncharacterized protein n=1 Tax=Pseudodesulfovibrio sediminis TaxID=2810563 RepID=A0ABN6ESF0_9BACT|nr:DUF6331 family protein [Pseudodesulfovibrio sediminis]BCS88308.1 hypothetical protein PSDVSF_15500 [Pseudodesulfovibrio sediminis]